MSIAIAIVIIALSQYNVAIIIIIFCHTITIIIMSFILSSHLIHMLYILISNRQQLQYIFWHDTAEINIHNDKLCGHFIRISLHRSLAFTAANIYTYEHEIHTCLFTYTRQLHPSLYALGKQYQHTCSDIYNSQHVRNVDMAVSTWQWRGMSGYKNCTCRGLLVCWHRAKTGAASVCF